MHGPEGVLRRCQNEVDGCLEMSYKCHASSKVREGSHLTTGNLNAAPGCFAGWALQLAALHGNPALTARYIPHAYCPFHPRDCNIECNHRSRPRIPTVEQAAESERYVQREMYTNVHLQYDAWLRQNAQISTMCSNALGREAKRAH
jgi:hypothetical protein